MYIELLLQVFNLIISVVCLIMSLVIKKKYKLLQENINNLDEQLNEDYEMKYMPHTNKIQNTVDLEKKLQNTIRDASDIIEELKDSVRSPKKHHKPTVKNNIVHQLKGVK